MLKKKKKRRYKTVCKICCQFIVEKERKEYTHICLKMGRIHKALITSVASKDGKCVSERQGRRETFYPFEFLNHVNIMSIKGIEMKINRIKSSHVNDLDCYEDLIICLKH